MDGHIEEFIPQIDFDMSEGQVMVLVSFDEASQKFSIPEEALSELGKYDEGICLVSMIGQPESGKSWLLNKVINQNAFGANTKNVYFWTKPIIKDTERLNVFLVDCPHAELFSDHSNGKLFSLMYLISSILVFNSKGPITENVMSLWRHLTTLSDYFTVADQKEQNDFNMVYYSPRVLWLLRDVDANALRDIQGRPIRPEQYMEQTLTALNAGGLSEEGRKIRQTFLNIIKNRECIAFPHPAQRESLTQFENSLNKLKERIFSRSTCKTMDGLNLNCAMFVTYLNELVEWLNHGHVFPLFSVWDKVVEKECAVAFIEATEAHKMMLKERFGSQTQPYQELELDMLTKKIRDDTMALYTKLAYLSVNYEEIYEEYLKKIQNHILQKEIQIYEINSLFAKEKNEELGRAIFDKIEQKARMGGYSHKNPQELTGDLGRALDTYGSQAIGSSAVEVLKEVLKRINSAVLKSIESQARSQLQSTSKALGPNSVNIGLEVDLKGKQEALDRTRKRTADNEERLRNLKTEYYENNDRVKKWLQEKDAYVAKKERLEKDIREQESKLETLKQEKAVIQSQKKRWWQCF